MHRSVRLALFLGLILLIPPASSQDAAALIEQARTGTAVAQKEARDALVNLGPAAIPPLFARLASVSAADDVVAQMLANAVVQAAARPELARTAMAAALINEVRSIHPVATRRYAMELLSYVAGLESVQPLSRLLRHAELGEMARWTLARVPGEEATRALSDALPAATGELKIGLINALGSRRATAAIPALSEALQSSEEPVRIAARRALARIPDAGLEKALRAGLAATSERERNHATDAYLALADTLLASGKYGRRPAVRIYRWAVEEGSESRVRVAGVVGLSKAGGKDSVSALLTALENRDRDVRGAATAALVAAPGQTNALVRAAGRGNPETRRLLYAVLGRRRDALATPTLLKAAREGDAETATVALAALGELRDPSSAGALIQLAETGPEAARPAALAAFLAVAGEEKDPARAEAAYLRGLNCATRDEERRTALRGLGALGRPSSLAAIEPYLAAGALRSDAAAAAAVIADRLAAGGEKDRALALYRRALEASGDSGLRRRIVSRLRDLGVDLDPAAEQGFVTRWYALGPLAGRGRWTNEDAFDPKSLVDVKQPVRVDGANLSWKATPVNDPDGMLDLEAAVSRRGDCVAYLYAEVVSPGAQEALFKVGSDDGFILWVNGERVGQNLSDRGYAAEQDTVRAPLLAGLNRVMIKVTQGGGQWAVGVRITAPDGAALKLEQRKLD